MNSFLGVNLDRAVLCEDCLMITQSSTSECGNCSSKAIYSLRRMLEKTDAMTKRAKYPRAHVERLLRSGEITERRADEMLRECEPEPVADVGGGLPKICQEDFDKAKADEIARGGEHGINLNSRARFYAALREIRKLEAEVAELKANLATSTQLRELLIEVMTNIGALSLTRNPRGQELRKRVTAALAPTPPEER